MKAKRIIFAVLCVLLVLVIIMTGIIIARINRLYQQPSQPAPTTPPSSNASTPSGETHNSSAPTDDSTAPPETEHVHDFVLTDSISATCEGYGWNIYTCSTCGYVDMPSSERKEPLGHSYNHSQVVAPTCTEGGYTEFICSRCSKVVVKDETDPLGHQFDEGTEVPATCTENAHTLFCCLNEGCTETKMENIQENTMTEHTYGPWTDLETGETVQYCEVCGKIRYFSEVEDPSVQSPISVENTPLTEPSGMFYLITVRVGENPEADIRTYTVYDYLNNGTIAFYYDEQKGLVIQFVDPDGMDQAYSLTGESLTIQADGSVAGG